MSKILILILILVLSSCTSSNKESSQATPQSGEISNLQKNEEPKQPSVALMPTSSGSQKVLTVEDIDAISTIDELARLDPMNIDRSKKDDKVYINLQKNKIKLNILLAEISDPEYIRLGAEERKILEGRAIWTDGIKKLSQEASDSFMNVNMSTEARNDIFDKKGRAIEALKLTSEYVNYITSNKRRLDAIGKEKEKYYSPEILKIQEEIK